MVIIFHRDEYFVETSGLTKGLQMESESTQTDDLKSGTGAPPGVVMVERNMLSKLQQELSVLKVRGRMMEVA